MQSKKIAFLVAALAAFMLLQPGLANADGSLTDNPGVSPAPTASAAHYSIVIDKKAQVLTVLTRDSAGRYTVVNRQMKCSTGMPGSSTVTPEGSFRIYAKKRWMSAPKYGVFAQYASRINGPILIHSVTYTKTNPKTLVRQSYLELGKPTSHGCIRLTVRDAKWIYANCPFGTAVRVVASGGPAVTKMQPIPALPAGATWDPTDTGVVH